MVANMKQNLNRDWLLSGLLRYEEGIDVGSTIVLMTTKGEAIAIAVAQLATSMMASCDHGCVAKVSRVIMDRDTYPRRCASVKGWLLSSLVAPKIFGCSSPIYACLGVNSEVGRSTNIRAVGWQSRSAMRVCAWLRCERGCCRRQLRTFVASYFITTGVHAC